MDPSKKQKSKAARTVTTRYDNVEIDELCEEDENKEEDNVLHDVRKSNASDRRNRKYIKNSKGMDLRAIKMIKNCMMMIFLVLQ